MMAALPLKILSPLLFCLKLSRGIGVRIGHGDIMLYHAMVEDCDVHPEVRRLMQSTWNLEEDQRSTRGYGASRRRALPEWLWRCDGIHDSRDGWQEGCNYVNAAQDGPYCDRCGLLNARSVGNNAVHPTRRPEAIGMHGQMVPGIPARGSIVEAMSGELTQEASDELTQRLVNAAPASSSGSLMKRGRFFWGTFTRANCCSPVSGSRIKAAMLKLRLLMKGNG